MRRTLAALVIAIATWIVAAQPRPADACGGCFSPGDAVTTVDSHRMAIAIGAGESTLWDQIVYSGDPSDFVWVLPVPTPEVTIEIADPAFFDALETGTSPIVQPLSPAPVCPQFDSGDGCGDSSSIQDFNGYGTGEGDNVTIFGMDTVGPYESVTIGSEEPQALYDWLNDNGYDVPLVYYSTLDYYIDEGYVFVALRLAPGEGVSAMAPIRIHYPGPLMTFPLRMVTVGSKGLVSLTLWVLAEQRYEVPNYGTIQIDASRLSWDWNTNRSNYRELFDDTVEDAGNRAWVVEYAGAIQDDAIVEEGGPGRYVPLSGDDYDRVLDAIAQPYLTRLRTSILNAHIDEDLQLAISADPAPVSATLFAPIDLNYSELSCPGESDTGCRVARRQSARAVVAFVLTFAAAAVFWRRRRRRRGEDVPA